MGLPHKNAATEQYLQAGDHMEAMLDLEDKTRVLLPPIEEADQSLEKLQQEKRVLEKAQARAYARVLWSNRKLGDEIRDVAGELKKADRKNQSSTFYATFFPEGGYSDLIRPSGRMLSKLVEDILARLPRLDALVEKIPSLAAHKTSLEDLCHQAKAALKTLEDADRKLAQKKAEIQVAILAWRDAAYTTEAELSKLFPGKKDLVRDFFPPTRKSKK